MNEKLYIVGYFREHPDVAGMDEAALTIVVFENSLKDGSRTWLEGYNVQSGHFELKDAGYLKTCTRITREAYLQATQGWHTPPEYLELPKDAQA